MSGEDGEGKPGKTLSAIADDAVKGYDFSEADYIYGGVGSILLMGIDSVKETGSPEAFLRFAVAYQEAVNERLKELGLMNNDGSQKVVGYSDMDSKSVDQAMQVWEYLSGNYPAQHYPDGKYPEWMEKQVMPLVEGEHIRDALYYDFKDSGIYQGGFKSPDGNYLVLRNDLTLEGWKEAMSKHFQLDKPGSREDDVPIMAAKYSWNRFNELKAELEAFHPQLGTSLQGLADYIGESALAIAECNVIERELQIIESQVSEALTPRVKTEVSAAEVLDEAARKSKALAAETSGP